LILLLSVLNAQCVIDADGYRFNFTPLAGKQVSWTSPQESWNYVFTFCDTAPCGDRVSSLCQSNQAGSDINDLGSWKSATNWRGSAGHLIARLGDGDPRWCPEPRFTNASFKCVDGPPALVGVVETASCQYQAQIQVPQVVCKLPNACCTPPTYSAYRIQDDGSLSVFQADGATMSWFDQNFQNSGSSMLCLKSFDRCFSFTPQRCTGSDYRPAPSQCFGTNLEWNFVKSTWVGFKNIPQNVWYSAKDSSYVVTMPVPIDSTSDCIVVSGNKADSSFEFTTSPNTTFWEIPKNCLKLIK